MYKSLFLAVLFLFQFPVLLQANPNHIDHLKAAFIREEDLWILQEGEEKQITKSGKVYDPKWSHDGKWVMYKKQVPSELPGKENQREIWLMAEPILSFLKKN